MILYRIYRSSDNTCDKKSLHIECGVDQKQGIITLFSFKRLYFIFKPSKCKISLGDNIPTALFLEFKLK